MSQSDDRIQRLEYARAMVAQLEEHLASGAGVFSVSIDGAYVQFQRGDAIKELEKWRKQVLRYSKTRSRFTSFNLRNSHD